MNTKMMKKIEIDSYIRELKKDYIIDPSVDFTYLILSDNTVTISINDSDIISDTVTKADIIEELKNIMKKPIW